MCNLHAVKCGKPLQQVPRAFIIIDLISLSRSAAIRTTNLCKLSHTGG